MTARDPSAVGRREHGGRARGTPARGPAARGLAVQRLTGLAELHALRAEWHELMAAAAPTSIFSSWEWVVSWLEHFRPRGPLLVLTVRDGGGRLVGIAPCSFTPSVPLAPRVLYLLGSGHALTEYVDAVVHRDVAAEAARVIVEALDAARSEWDLLGMPLLPANGPLAACVQALAPARGYRVFVEQHGRVARPLPGSWAAFYRSLRKSMKDNVNNYLNRLRREGRTEALEIVEDPRGTDAALDTFFELHRRRSRTPGRHEHHDKFATEDRRRFLRTAVRRLAEQGRAWVCFLHVDGQPVAAQVCLADRRRLYPYYSGYDPAWWAYGVMLILTRRCIETAIARGFTELDLMVGAHQDKLRWGGQAEPVLDLVVAHHGLRSRLAFEVLRRYKARRSVGSVRVLAGRDGG